MRPPGQRPQPRDDRVRRGARAHIVDPLEDDHRTGPGLRQDIPLQPVLCAHPTHVGAHPVALVAVGDDAVRGDAVIEDAVAGQGALCLEAAGEDIGPAAVGAARRLHPVGDRVAQRHHRARTPVDVHTGQVRPEGEGLRVGRAPRVTGPVAAARRAEIRHLGRLLVHRRRRHRPRKVQADQQIRGGRDAEADRLAHRLRARRYPGAAVAAVEGQRYGRAPGRGARVLHRHARRRDVHRRRGEGVRQPYPHPRPARTGVDDQPQRTVRPWADGAVARRTCRPTPRPARAVVP